MSNILQTIHYKYDKDILELTQYDSSQIFLYYKSRYIMIALRNYKLITNEYTNIHILLLHLKNKINIYLESQL
jgi:hypothetical protein